MPWAPATVIKVVSEGGRRRDLIEKREESLRPGVLGSGILDPQNRRLHVLRRLGDSWKEIGKAYGIHLLPGLVVDPGVLLRVAGKA